MIPALLALWVLQFVFGVKFLSWALYPISGRDRLDTTILAATGFWLPVALIFALTYVASWLTPRRR